MTHFLADTLGLCAVGEYAREFLSQTGGHYVQSDLVDIARGQQKRIQGAMEGCPRGVVSDTGPVVLKVWSQWKYGSVDDHLADVLPSLMPSVFVLCTPDIPWEYDPLRESESDRVELFGLYRSVIARLKVPCVIAEGLGDQRQFDVLDQIRSYVKTLP